MLVCMLKNAAGDDVAVSESPPLSGEESSGTCPLREDVLSPGCVEFGESSWSTCAPSSVSRFLSTT
jgi:hypothetical protein